MKGDCKNCGAPEGLHHYETGQCPVNGVEAPIGRKQEYQYTRFEENDDRDERIGKLAATVAALTETIATRDASIDALKRQIDQLTAENEALQKRVADAAKVIKQARAFADYVGRDVPITIGGEAELWEAAARWLEQQS